MLFLSLSAASAAPPVFEPGVKRAGGPYDLPGGRQLYITNDDAQHSWSATLRIYSADAKLETKQLISDNNELRYHRLITLKDGGFVIAMAWGDPIYDEYYFFYDAKGTFRAKSDRLSSSYDDFFAQLPTGEILISYSYFYPRVRASYFSPRGEELRTVELQERPITQPLLLKDSSIFFISEKRHAWILFPDGSQLKKTEFPPVPNPLPHGVYYGNQEPILLRDGSILFIDYNYKAETYTVFVLRSNGEDTGKRIEFDPKVSGFAQLAVALPEGGFAQMSYQYQEYPGGQYVSATVITIFDDSLSVVRRIRLDDVEGVTFTLAQDGRFALRDRGTGEIVYVSWR